MLNKKGKRELAYVVQIDNIIPIEGADRVETAVVGGWHVMVRKNQFKVGDYAIYFEIDSKVPEKEPFMFLADKHFKIKTQKYFKGKVISQGLLMSFSDFCDKENGGSPAWLTAVSANLTIGLDIKKDPIFLTQELGVKYSSEEDNKRKMETNKYDKMYQRHIKLFKKYGILRKIYKYKIGKKLLFLFLGKKKDTNNSGWPVGKFPGVSKTDQERCENMTWVLEDKTPYIVTQKCDGSSGTYILERKPFNKFEFYVCSRNVRMFKSDQECYYGNDNVYWKAAEKYNIEEKMKKYLDEHKDINWVCWQGEICAPNIQGNPHKLKDIHFYCFHMTDSKNGRYDIREAKKIWNKYDMEVVPIVSENYILPDDFELFKLSADGVYNKEVCEGAEDCLREGFVYYKTTDPTFSFKNVSREYLISRNQ